MIHVFACGFAIGFVAAHLCSWLDTVCSRRAERKAQQCRLMDDDYNRRRFADLAANIGAEE